MQEPAATAPLVLICAMPRELRPLARRLSLRPERRLGGSVYRGTLAGKAVLGVVTGMGTELAAAATKRLLDATAVDQVVVVGISGALDDSTPIGTVIAPEIVVDGSTGAQYRAGPLRGITQRGTLRTSDILVTDPAAVAGLRSQGVVALDMETAAIARECEHRGIRWSVLRAISDRAGDGSVDAGILGLNHPDGTPDPAAIIRYLMSRPARAALLARLARDSRTAVTAAADAAIRACSPG